VPAALPKSATRTTARASIIAKLVRISLFLLALGRGEPVL
jgi:hypothetical protein